MGCLMASEKMPTVLLLPSFTSTRHVIIRTPSPVVSYTSPKSVGLRRRDINVPGTILLPFHIISGV